VLTLSLIAFGLSTDIKFTPTVNGSNVCFPYDQADQLRQAFENESKYKRKILMLSNQIELQYWEIMEISSLMERQKYINKNKNIRSFFTGASVGSGSTIAVLLVIIIKNAFF
jgi:hypothetical protein